VEKTSQTNTQDVYSGNKELHTLTAISQSDRFTPGLKGKMKTPALKWELLAIIPVSLRGAFLHFAFELSGEMSSVGLDNLNRHH
jgi:hypothetical protein